MPATPLSFRESNCPEPRLDHRVAPNGLTDWAPDYAANDDTRRHITAIAIVLGCVAAVTFALVKSGQTNTEASAHAWAQEVAAATEPATAPSQFAEADVGASPAYKTEVLLTQDQSDPQLAASPDAGGRHAAEEKLAILERALTALKQARETAEAALAKKIAELDAERAARQAAEQRATAAETRARQSAVEPSAAVERRLADATSALPEAKTPANGASD